MPSNFKKLASKKKVKTITLTIEEALYDVDQLVDDIELEIEDALLRLEDRGRDDTERYDQLGDAASEISVLGLAELPKMLKSKPSVANDTIEVPKHWVNRKSIRTMRDSAVMLLEACHKYLAMLSERELFIDTDGVVADVASAIDDLKGLDLPKLKVKVAA